MVNVLIVDDENILLKILIKYMEKIPSVNPIGCSNWKDALKCAQTLKLDLIITDFKLSELNGIQLIKSVRELTVNSNVPVLFYSGFVDEIRGDLVEECNVTILEKPASRGDFINAVKKILNAA